MLTPSLLGVHAAMRGFVPNLIGAGASTLDVDSSFYSVFSVSDALHPANEAGVLQAVTPSSCTTSDNPPGVTNGCPSFALRLAAGTDAHSLSGLRTATVVAAGFTTSLQMYIERPALRIELSQSSFRRFDGCTSTFEQVAARVLATAFGDEFDVTDTAAFTVSSGSAAVSSNGVVVPSSTSDVVLSLPDGTSTTLSYDGSTSIGPSDVQVVARAATSVHASVDGASTRASVVLGHEFTGVETGTVFAAVSTGSRWLAANAYGLLRVNVTQPGFFAAAGGSQADGFTLSVLESAENPPCGTTTIQPRLHGMVHPLFCVIQTLRSLHDPLFRMPKPLVQTEQLLSLRSPFLLHNLMQALLKALHPLQ